jgi:site-specific recombinase XerD
MLGHTNLKTTQIYSKVIDTKISEDMDKVQERLAKRKIS